MLWLRSWASFIGGGPMQVGRGMVGRRLTLPFLPSSSPTTPALPLSLRVRARAQAPSCSRKQAVLCQAPRVGPGSLLLTFI